MKKIILSVLISFSIFLAQAQSNQEKKVAATVEQLRQAMISGESHALTALVSDKLSYGHSGGHIDDKKEFLDKLTTGKSDFVTLEFAEQTISVSRKTAIVRHILNAKTNDNNVPGEVHLRVLLVFQKQSGHWVLLARQAVKLS